MQDSVIQQILNTQTQMLQQINTMLSNQGSNSFGAAPMMTKAPAMMQSAAPSAGALAGSMWSGYYNYNPTRMSIEGQADAFGQQNRALQEGAMNALNTGVNGAATAGSFFVPGGFVASMAAGTIAGAAVAGTTAMMMGGARTAMNYEQTVQQKGYMMLNPFNSHSEMGGIGFSRGDTQNIASFLRHVGPDQLLGDQDIQQILNGGLDNRLLKGTTDLESFKKKFTSLVEAVKNITLTMNQSIEQSTQFMGEMDRRGISVGDMPMYAAQTKVTASMLGVSASIGAQMTMQTADAITQGTGINAGLVMQTTNKNMFMSSLLTDRTKTQDPNLYQYIMNSGGAGQFGANTEQTIRQYISGQGSSSMLGLLASGFDKGSNGEFVVNESRMNDLLGGNYSTQQLMSKSQATMSGMSAADQYALKNQSPNLFQNYAGSSQEYQLVNLMKNQYQSTTPGMSDASALQVMGLAQNSQQAQAIAEMTRMATDPRIQESMASLTMKQKDDAAMIANSPSIPQRVRYGFASLENRVGDVGQNVSDSFSNAFWSLQQFSTGIGDRSSVLGGRSYDTSSAGIAKEFGVAASDKINQNAKDMQQFHNSNQTAYDVIMNGRGPDYASMAQGTSLSIDTMMAKASSNTLGFSSDDFNSWSSQISAGQLSPADMARLSQQLKDPKTSGYERTRIQYLVDQYQGSTSLSHTLSGYRIGFMDKFNSAENSALSFMGNAIKSIPDGLGGKGTSQTLLGQEYADIDKARQGADRQLATMLSTMDPKSSSYEDLQTAIQSGDATKVQNLNDQHASAAMLALTAQYQTYADRDSSAAGAANTLLGHKQYAEVYAKSTKDIEGMLVGGNILTKSAADRMFGGLNKTADQLLKNVKKDSFSDDDAIRGVSSLSAGLAAKFKSMPQSVLDALAVSLVKDSGNTIDKASLFVSANDQNIDPNKLSMAAMRFASAQHNDVQSDYNKAGAASTAKQSAAEVQLQGTIDGHVKTMGEMIMSFQNEMKLMRDAISNSKSRQMTAITTK